MRYVNGTVMVTKRTTPKGGDAIDGAAALKAAIHVARARAGITSDVQLAIRAGVSYDTLMNWFGGRTVPRPHELKKVASALGMGYGDLMAAYEGSPAEPPSLVQAVTALVEEMRLERELGQDAAQAMLRAAEALLEAQRAFLTAQPRAGDGASTEPPARRGSGR